MTKVSVIVAAYNVEKYIEDTLYSLVNQTMEDAEFIIVDDCSTDKTGEIIKAYAGTDNRIKYIKLEENKGTMLVCKAGCDAARGEYIMFLDGDDMLDFKACEIAYKAVKKEKVDILQYDIEVFGDKDVLKKRSDVVEGLYAYLGNFNTKVIAHGKGGLISCKHSRDKINFTMRNKIFKKHIVDKANSQLPDEYLIMAEDMLFAYIACYYAKSYAYIKNKLYKYRIGSGISTAQKFSRNKILSIAKSAFVYDYLYKWTQSQNALDLCKTRLNAVKMQMYNNIGDMFLKQLSGTDRTVLMEEVMKYISLETFICIISYMTQNDKLVSPDKLVEICSDLKISKTKKTEKKTIGTFYYRMYNGGAENVVAQLTDIWVKNGYNVILFTDQPENEDDYYINPDVVRVVLPKYTYGKFESYEKRIRVLRENLSNYNVDIMVYHAWMNPYLVYDALAVKSLGIRFAVHTHGTFCSEMVSVVPDAAYSNATIHKIYSHLCDMVITLNKVDQAYWSALGVRCIQTVNPISFPLSTQTAALNGKNVLMTCRISREKQVEDAVKIIEKVKEKIPDVLLTIVGSGDDLNYSKSITEYIKTNNLEKNVKMVGFKKNVVPYYLNADVMLFTSKYEGFPLSLLESKICGLPLVIYNLANLDTVRTAEGMRVVPQGDTTAAAEKIVEILSDTSLKKQLGSDARASAEKILSIDLSKHWNFIFDEILNEMTVKNEQDNLTDTALKVLLNYTAQGIALRSASQTEVTHIGTPAHTAQLEATIKEIRSSTSYRLGWFLTTIPRKIKDFIKGQKYVE